MTEEEFDQWVIEEFVPRLKVSLLSTIGPTEDPYATCKEGLEMILAMMPK